ncbi:MAG: SO2930 family diheme c-type cytochrome [Sphingomonas sp.]
MTRLLAFMLGALLLAGCANRPDQVTFHATDNPESLADWGLFTVKDGRITPHQGMVTYELQTPLFSDYAQKWRTVWMPKGAAATYDAEKAFDFPVGTIVTKTFYYTVPDSAAKPGESTAVVKMTPATYQRGIAGLDLRHVRLIETRLLVRRTNGWEALPYVWNADQTEAKLDRTGEDIPLDLVDGPKHTPFVYSVPNANQCAGCHTADFHDRKLMPIGLKAGHLNRLFGGPGGEINQLQRLAAIGYLKGLPGADVPHEANWQDAAAPIGERARAYLDVNCAHCHNANAPARTSGLWLDAKTLDPRLIGACKPPVAAGRGTGNRPFDIVPGHPERSIISYRLASTDPGEMMPELGRSLEHQEGVAMIADWIITLKGACTVETKPDAATGSAW